jgi:hypothetical protein
MRPLGTPFGLVDQILHRRTQASLHDLAIDGVSIAPDILAAVPRWNASSICQAGHSAGVNELPTTAREKHQTVEQLKLIVDTMNNSVVAIPRLPPY